jgi:hypothetical protein
MTHAAPPALQAALCGQLLQPLLAMLGDPVERCRAGALQLLLEASARVPQLEPLLPPLLGALGARVGQLPPLEPAEELRLQAAALVGRAVERASPRWVQHQRRCLASTAFGCNDCKAGCRMMVRTGRLAGQAVW